VGLCRNLTTNPATIASITLPSGRVISYSTRAESESELPHAGKQPTTCPPLKETTADGSTTYTRTIRQSSPITPHCGNRPLQRRSPSKRGSRTNVSFIRRPTALGYLSRLVMVAIATSWLQIEQTMEGESESSRPTSNLRRTIRTSARCYNGSRARRTLNHL